MTLDSLFKEWANRKLDGIKDMIGKRHVTLKEEK
jgi:hypothetical protein